AEPGSVAGTPMYMAPEAFDGQVSPALDVYSLAAALFKLATGEFHFAPGSLPNLLYQKLQGLPEPDLRCKAIPEPLERIIRAGMAAKPADRPGIVNFVATLRGSLNQLLADALAPNDCFTPSQMASRPECMKNSGKTGMPHHPSPERRSRVRKRWL